MTGNVIGLDGSDIKVGEPDEKIVEVLRDLLERAESGNMIGLCVSYLDEDELAGRSLVGKYSLRLLGSWAVNQALITQQIIGDD